LDTFSFVATGDRKKTITALNTRVEFANGNEQVQQNSINPKIIWERTYGGTYDEMLEIQSFFDSHAPGGVLFYWTEETDGSTTGTQHTVRFASDTCDITQKFGWDENGNGIKAYSVTLQFRKVII